MKKIQVTRSPIDNSVYVERQQASNAQIQQTLTLATKAQKLWRQSSIKERAEICHRMVDIFIANEDEISQQLCWMMGRPIQYAKNEVTTMAQRARYMIDVAETALATIETPSPPDFTCYIKLEPLGVVLAIAPWNYPYLTAINVIIPAIMSGNSVILKHSAQTPLCAEQLASAFKQAALPEGVFQYLHLSHSDTESLIKQYQPNLPRINYVAFTGSVTGGKMIEQASSGRFIGVGLELGGKDPAYVRADADIDYAVETCIDGAFFNSGQSCCAVERIYVHKQVFDQFVVKAVKLINQYKLGRPDDPDTTLGPVVNTSAANFVREQIKEAIQSGAIPHIEELNFPLAQTNSPYLAPQLLTNVDHSMRLMTEETFGPVIGVMSVNDDHQAIALMNDSEFGLTASVFSSNISTAVEIGEQLETGTFFINRCDYVDPALAWVGVKNSGRGCTLSELGYQSYTRPKSFHLKAKRQTKDFSSKNQATTQPIS